jgi:hypothetical protein
MILPDRSPSRSLARVWHAVGRRLAVAAGASTALVSLLFHNTLLTASLRGALALLAALIVVRIGHALIVRAPARASLPTATPVPTARTPARRIG